MSESGKKLEISSTQSGVGLAVLIHDLLVCRQESTDFRFELDVPPQLVCPADEELISQLVGTVVDAALEDFDGHDHGACELLITACELNGCVEIEVADNGPVLAGRPRRIPLVTAHLHANLFWQDCPQGGVAVTAVIPRNQRERQAA